MLELFGPYLGFIILILLGLIVGGAMRRAHLQNLAQRELQTQEMLITQLKSFPGADPTNFKPTLMVAEVVIGSDYLTTFFAKLRNIFGGEVRSYRSLLERTRREVLLRIVEQAQAEGYNAVCNVRLDPVDIAGSNLSKKKAAMAALMASGTAYHAST